MLKEQLLYVYQFQSITDLIETFDDFCTPYNGCLIIWDASVHR